jgi:MFS family permease
VLIVFLVVFINLLGFGIVLPLLPRFGEMYIDQLIPGGKESRLSGAILGLLMSSFSFMHFLVVPVWGQVSDRVGRRPILLLGLGGSVIFYALFGVACELPTSQAGLAVALLFITRLGAGVAGATIAPAQAVVADTTPPERRKHGMAMIGAAWGIGFTFGPLVGFGALSFFPTHVGSLGFVAAGLSLIALLLGLRLLPETWRPGTTAMRRRWLNWDGVRSALQTPTVGLLILAFFLSIVGFSQFEATLSLLNKDILKLPNTQNFLVFAYVGLVLMLVQGLVYRRLAHRVREETFMSLGIVLMGLGVAGLGGATWLALQPDHQSELDHPDPAVLAAVLVNQAVAVTGFAFVTPSIQALISRRSDPSKQGEILGANQSAGSMARILGPLLGLSLYGLEPSHLLPYAVGAALILLMLPLIPRIRRGAEDQNSV